MVCSKWEKGLIKNFGNWENRKNSGIRKKGEKEYAFIFVCLLRLIVFC